MSELDEGGSVSVERIIGFIRLIFALMLFGFSIAFLFLMMYNALFEPRDVRAVVVYFAGATLSLLFANHFFKACSERDVED